MNIYVASSWRNSLQPEVVDWLAKAGHDVYDFRNPEPGNDGFAWSSIDPHWESWSLSRYKDALTHPLAEKGFMLDFSAMRDADACVLVMPCGRSAHLEAGYFVGAGKPLLIFMAAGAEPELMYKMADGIIETRVELLQRLEEIEELIPGIPGAVRADGQPDPV